MSTFTGLVIGSRGLTASTAALLVTNTNISNVNTSGYSRQTVTQQAVTPAAVYGGQYVGSGAEVTSVDRVRNIRLDQKYWQENAKLSTVSTTADRMKEVESVLGTTDDNGIATMLNQLYSAMESVSTDPGSSAARATLKEAGISVCKSLQEAAQQLNSLREDCNGEVHTAVTQINAYAQQLAALNEKIRSATAGNSSSSELEDERDAILDKLSSLVDVSATQTVVGKLTNGKDDVVWSVTIGGVTLVNGGNARQLSCEASGTEGMYNVAWADTGDAFEPRQGELAAQLNLRDGTGSDAATQGIPYYRNQLDTFARTFAKAFNEGIFADGTDYYSGHADGYGLDGSTGIRFFTHDGVSSAALMAGGSDMDSIYSQITAANISLSSDVEADTNKIAAASTSGGTDNNETMSALLKLCADRKMFNTGTPEDFLNSIVASMGTNSEYAQTMTSKQSSFVKAIDSRRTSISGVSTNEETANLTKYQQAYEASAKVVSTWDSIYSATISMVND